MPPALGLRPPRPSASWSIRCPALTVPAAPPMLGDRAVTPAWASVLNERFEVVTLRPQERSRPAPPGVLSSIWRVHTPLGLLPLTAARPRLPAATRKWPV